MGVCKIYKWLHDINKPCMHTNLAQMNHTKKVFISYAWFHTILVHKACNPWNTHTHTHSQLDLNKGL